jgi:hypothetical protein
LNQPPSPKRKHVRTGQKPPGGAREGAGRKEGGNPLEYGEVRALKSIRHRVPEGTPKELALVADQALGQIVSVMRGEVPSFMGHAAAVLKASSMVREEVCGPLAQKLNVGGADGGPLEIVIRDEAAE